jgi:hypothetical protein
VDFRLGLDSGSSLGLDSGFSVGWIPGFLEGLLNFWLSVDHQIQQYKDCCSFPFYITFSVIGIIPSMFGRSGQIKHYGTCII